ncbi:MAG: glutamate racemase [Catenisphaera adipataccumulans]|jgi:glutamate racemase|uniref:glutamate racemase n=1 Tax=Catenisphaera adipataccumulans TaxID=700500 RepID=UPI003D8A183D
MQTKDPIGVFDSGMGGVTVVHTLHRLLPHEDILFVGDSKYNPYGTKTKAEITVRCISICDALIQRGVKAIVIACNTATSACVPLLRERYDIDIIGMEPALKPACEAGPHQKIAVWATNFTLKEKKFADLMQRFENEHTIYKEPCPDLVQLVEQDRLDQKDEIDTALRAHIAHHPDVDSIVLGCTHYVFYRQVLTEILGSRVRLIDGNEGTVLHVKDLLAQKNLLNSSGTGQIEWKDTLAGKEALCRSLFERLEESK